MPDRRPVVTVPVDAPRRVPRRRVHKAVKSALSVIQDNSCLWLGRGRLSRGLILPTVPKTVLLVNCPLWSADFGRYPAPGSVSGSARRGGKVDGIISSVAQGSAQLIAESPNRGQRQSGSRFDCHCGDYGYYGSVGRNCSGLLCRGVFSRLCPGSRGHIMLFPRGLRGGRRGPAWHRVHPGDARWRHGVGSPASACGGEKSQQGHLRLDERLRRSGRDRNGSRRDRRDQERRCHLGC
jgi:hypothetical protein